MAICRNTEFLFGPELYLLFDQGVEADFQKGNTCTGKCLKMFVSTIQWRSEILNKVGMFFCT